MRRKQPTRYINTPCQCKTHDSVLLENRQCQMYYHRHCLTLFPRQISCRMGFLVDGSRRYSELFRPPAAPCASKRGIRRVSVPIAIGLLVMMYPILCKVQYETLPQILTARSLWLHFAFSFVTNWIVAPLLMVSATEGASGLLPALMLMFRLVSRRPFYLMRQNCGKA